MTAESDEPTPERVLSWAEVYSSRNCGGCGHADCPHCTTQFLTYLKANGTSQAAQAKGLT